MCVRSGHLGRATSHRAERLDRGSPRGGPAPSLLLRPGSGSGQLRGREPAPGESRASSRGLGESILRGPLGPLPGRQRPTAARPQACAAPSRSSHSWALWRLRVVGGCPFTADGPVGSALRPGVGVRREAQLTASSGGRTERAFREMCALGWEPLAVVKKGLRPTRSLHGVRAFLGVEQAFVFFYVPRLCARLRVSQH